MKPYEIENDRQYEITRGWVAQFEAALAETAGDGPPENENGRTAWELGRAGMGGILNTTLIPPCGPRCGSTDPGGVNAPGVGRRRCGGLPTPAGVRWRNRSVPI